MADLMELASQLRQKRQAETAQNAQLAGAGGMAQGASKVGGPSMFPTQAAAPQAATQSPLAALAQGATSYGKAGGSLSDLLRGGASAMGGPTVAGPMAAMQLGDQTGVMPAAQSALGPMLGSLAQPGDTLKNFGTAFATGGIGEGLKKIFNIFG